MFIPRTSLAALGVMFAFTASVTFLVEPAYAEETNGPQAIRFDIRPGTLSQVLSRFSEVSGVQLVYSTDLVRGLESAGLSGEFSATDALTRLLEGSGLTARFSSAKTASLVRTSDRSRVLGPVRVEGAESRSAVNGVNVSRDVTATEGTGSFTTGAMTIGSKAPRSIKDTPQSVSVITAERLEEQNVTDYRDALNHAPGVSLAQGGSSLESVFYSRAFEITSIQIDGGAPLTTQFPGGLAYFPQIDLSQYDHIEVLRGAAGLFNGYGDPSGTINLVRKKPRDREQATLEAEWGSWKHHRAVLDATGPLGFGGDLRGRLVMTWQENEHFYEVAEDSRTLIYGILEYDLTPTTLVGAGASQTSQDSVPWEGGLPRYLNGADLRLPRNTGLVFPWNRWSFDTTEIFGSIEQEIGEHWTVKLNLTDNQQSSTRKLGSSTGYVNPLNGSGPLLDGSYADYASHQWSAETTLSGSVALFGQRQEMTMGLNRVDSDGGGQTLYASPISSSQAAPYQPYPGGPRYCYTTSASNPCPGGTIPPRTPPINVFAFNPFDPIYNEPANPLPNYRAMEQGQVQSLAYLNLRLTAFDRLHLETGLRWSRYERKSASERYCTTIPTSGTPNATNCVGRRIGDAYSPQSSFYVGEQVSWPPALALSYDIADSLTTYLGYTDIYQDQSNALDGDLEPLDAITGENVELGIKWTARGGRLNASLAAYRIEKQGFARQEPAFSDRYRRNPDGSIYRDANGALIVVANDGTELPNGRPDPYHACCYIQREDQSQLSEGLEAEVIGELFPGGHISVNYTFSQNKQEGTSFGSSDGLPFVSIQPEHLYKVWVSYDLGAAGVSGWLSHLTLSAGANGQSEGYRSGSVCVNPAAPAADGTSSCLPGGIAPYEFTVDPYSVVSGRVRYRINDKWFAALNVENIFDESYYQSVGTGVGSGNWYGTPRNFALSVLGRF